MPKISVIMPAYNAATHIQAAIKSILEQSYADFELLIIDDGSTDHTSQIISGFCDPRIILIKNPTNSGLVFSLNRGILLAKGDFIARMDADDISMPTRLEKQITYMEECPDTIMCGTWAKTLGQNQGPEIDIMPPPNDQEIRAHMLFLNAFVHPSMMIRRSILLSHGINYRNTAAEDYDLWARLLPFGKVHNIPEILLEYRLHQNQLTKTNISPIYESADAVCFALIENSFGLIFSEAEKQAHRVIAGRATPKDSTTASISVICKILKSNQATLWCNQKYLTSFLIKKLLHMIRKEKLNFFVCIKDKPFRTITELFSLIGVRYFFKVLTAALRKAI